MSELDAAVWLRLGPLQLREPLLLAVLISALLAGLAGWLRRQLQTQADQPAGRLQTAIEAVYALMHDAVAEVVAPDEVARVLPFIATLWLFLVLANLIGLVPGLSSPTRDLSVTAALAVVVLVAVHAFGIRAAGLKVYLAHYLAPNPIMLPFHLISEVTRTLALAIRLFGNMMSLEMAALLVLLVAGLLVPIPLLLLHVVEALVQAYIFGMLALIYIASALEVSHEHRGEAASPASS